MQTTNNWLKIAEGASLMMDNTTLLPRAVAAYDDREYTMVNPIEPALVDALTMAIPDEPMA
jgi:hypothetical protein